MSAMTLWETEILRELSRIASTLETMLEVWREVAEELENMEDDD